MSSEGFGIIPKWIIQETDLSTHGIVVYVALSMYAKRGYCYPAISTLAKDARCSENTVRKALKELVAAGIVEVSKRKRESDDGQTSNGYKILTHEATPPQEMKGGGAGGEVGGVQEVNPNNTYLEQDLSNKVPPTPYASGGYASSGLVMEPLDREEMDNLRLASLLADLVEGNGFKRPSLSKAWLVDIERMRRIDGRTVKEIEGAMRWAAQDSFWYKNILSPGKLREKYDRLLADARDKQRATVDRVVSRESEEMRVLREMHERARLAAQGQRS